MLNIFCAARAVCMDARGAWKEKKKWKQRTELGTEQCVFHAILVRRPKLYSKHCEALDFRAKKVKNEQLEWILWPGNGEKEDFVLWLCTLGWIETIMSQHCRRILSFFAQTTAAQPSGPYHDFAPVSANHLFRRVCYPNKEPKEIS